LDPPFFEEQSHILQVPSAEEEARIDFPTTTSTEKDNENNERIIKDRYYSIRHVYTIIEVRSNQ
jgi:hypothetical protein